MAKGLLLLLSLFALTSAVLSATLTDRDGNTNLQCCGSSPIDPVGTTKSCCDSVSYDTTKSSCCPDPDGVHAHVASGTHTGCCKLSSGWVTYNPLEKACCTGASSLADHAQDLGTCCGTKFVLTSETTKGCCGSTTYDNTDSTCCNGFVVNGANRECCYTFKDDQTAKSARGFKPDTQTCCPDGSVLSGGTSTGRTSCCGDTAYDSTLENCCGGKHTYSITGSDACCNGELIDSKTTACCGTHKYDPSEKACCANSYLRKIDSEECCVDHPISNTEACCANTDHNLNAFGSAYNPQSRQCCLHDVPARSIRSTCCEDTDSGTSSSYDPEEQTCCPGASVVSGGDRHTACCKTSDFQWSSYNPAKKTCCDGRIRSIVDLVEPKCCGKKVYDETTHFCCGNDVFRRSDYVSPACCDDEPYDASDRDCCGGKHIYNPLESKCCTTETKSAVISPSDATCCGTSKGRGTGDACCGDELYFSATHTCCSGGVGTGNACCAGKAYDTTLKVCCADTSLNDILAGFECCGSKYYDTTLKICC